MSGSAASGLVRRAIAAARPWGPRLGALDQKARRRLFVAHIRASAVWNNATIDLDIADDVRIGHNVRVWIQPWTDNVLHIGPNNTLEDNVLIQLKGGQVLLGPDVELRRDVVLNVAGRLEVKGTTPISWNSVIHCSNRVTFDEMVGLAEQVTVADSSHYFTTPDEHFWHNVRVGEVSVGRNTWICPKVTLARGATIGAHCIVGSNSVVVGDVPDGSLASGVPVTIRPLPLPWADAVAAARQRSRPGA